MGQNLALSNQREGLGRHSIRIESLVRLAAWQRNKFRF